MSIIVSSIILLIVFNLYKYDKKLNIISKNSYSLGTLIKLTACGKNAEKAIEKAFKKLNYIDERMSAFRVESDISQINHNAGYKFQKVSKDTYFVIAKALEYSKILEGTFDPTIKPLVDVWGIGTKNEKIPTEKEIKEKLELVNYNDVILKEDSSSIMLKNKEQSLDVGGIAKGFAADEVKKIFLKYKIKNGLIDLGGNIFAYGCKNDNSFWKIGIQDPFKARGEYIAILNVKDKSVVTSGSYERYFIKDNKKFHHIIDPKTGGPSKSNIVSATIISDNSIDGDGLSTGIYILGVEKAIKIIESIKNVDAILITEDGKIYKTSCIDNNMLTVTNDKFYFAN